MLPCAWRPHIPFLIFLGNTGYLKCQVDGLATEGGSLCKGDGKASVIVSHEMFWSFVCILSKKAGFIGVPVISTLHVNIATTSDIGGLKFAWGWRHKKATWIVCKTSLSTYPSSFIFGSIRSITFAVSNNFHAYSLKPKRSVARLYINRMISKFLCK